MRESVKEKKVQKRYNEEFKRQAVELVIHSGKTQAQIARELGVSEYSLTLWKKDYLGHLKRNANRLPSEKSRSNA
jgi:transposase-like protein